MVVFWVEGSGGVYNSVVSKKRLAAGWVIDRYFLTLARILDQYLVSSTCIP